MTRKNKRVDDIYYGLSEGYCRICGEYGPLTVDHVPPKSAGNKVPVHISISGEYHESQNGAKFRTICSACNNRLGKEDDKTFVRLYKDMETVPNMTKFLNSRFYGVTVNPVNLIRSICGHLLAIWFGDDVKAELNEKPGNFEMMQDFRSFVNHETSLNNKYKIYYWYYPYDDCKIWLPFEKLIGFGGHSNLGIIFKTFPIGIWIIDTRESSALPHLRNIPLIDGNYNLKFDVKKVIPPDKPEMPEPDEITILSTDSVINVKNKEQKLFII